MFLLVACAEIPAPEPAPVAEPAPVEPAPVAAPEPAAAAPRLNLNTAEEADIAALPGMTPRMVHEFEEYRPYVSVEQFRREIGKYVDEAQVAAWEPLVFVPIDPNASDAATLRQIPGLDEAGAAALAAGRPYADTAAFFAKVAELAPGQDAAARALVGAP
jgi:DNA uptake protein ComE-like DNA-binding protein